MEQQIKESSNKQFNIKSLAGIIVGVTAAAIFQHFLFRTPTIDKQLMDAASELNKNCPIMADSQTRLDNAVSLPDNVLQYNYTLINLIKDSINVSDLEKSIEPSILNTVKTSPDLQAFRDNEVTMAYNYKDKNGIHLFKIIFKANQYK